MITLSRYLEQVPTAADTPAQAEWYGRLQGVIDQGENLLEQAGPDGRQRFRQVFDAWTRTEELKAWYGEPENGSLFQGTSVSSLTIPCELPDPLTLGGIEQLEDAIAEHYIRLHHQHRPQVQGAILENTDKWMSEGLFYGIVLGSKMISQAFGLIADERDLVFKVDGHLVDPHEITACPPDVREAYFALCRDRVECFADLPGFSRMELETSLVLADISKPRIAEYSGRLMLAPVRCNEIATVMANRVRDLIRAKTGGVIRPRSLSVTIYDTDTPYTYHQIAGYFGDQEAPVLPGLTVLGTSGTTDAFRWLYAYRCSLVAQKIMKSSLYSEVARRFIPFVYFGVLVERDAEILLDLDRLGLLRYRGNLSPRLEYAALVPKIASHLEVRHMPLRDEARIRLS